MGADDIEEKNVVVFDKFPLVDYLPNLNLGEVDALDAISDIGRITNIFAKYEVDSFGRVTSIDYPFTNGYSAFSSIELKYAD